MGATAARAAAAAPAATGPAWGEGAARRTSVAGAIAVSLRHERRRVPPIASASGVVAGVMAAGESTWRPGVSTPARWRSRGSTTGRAVAAVVASGWLAPVVEAGAPSAGVAPVVEPVVEPGEPERLS